MSAFLRYNLNGGEERVACGHLTSIGRDGGNDIVLPEPQVSRHHALIRRLGRSDYYLIDSGSSNGSSLNERRISVPTQLADGDRITIGGITLTFEAEPQQSTFSDSLSMQATVIMDEPVIKEVTLLVADIRGFTRLSEQLPIRTLTRLMHQWFEHANQVIAQHGGAVDKFIGDCVFARWESDSACNNVIRALRTACVLRDVTLNLHHDFSELSEPLFIGVGINTGMVSVGIGSENTVLGDAVNTTFRLESATRELGVDMVLSDEAYATLPNSLKGDFSHSLKLRGKSKAVNAVALDFTQAEALLSANPCLV